MDIRERKIRLRLENPPKMKFPVPVGLPKFSIVEERAVTCDCKGVPVKYLSPDDLPSSKRAVCRDRDADDILFLTIKKQNRPT